jgi:type II secretory pathway pseudopilin PulG
VTTRLIGCARRGDDSGSLAMAMLFILVSVSLSALLAPMVVTQTGSTRREMQRARALHAAMAGIDAAVGRIRAAVAADGRTGDLTKLPTCGATITGDHGTGTARYQVTVYYLDVDPLGQSEQWAEDNAICSTGRPARTPAYALLVATGTGQATGAFTDVPARSLHATYPFRTSNQPPPGGLIRALKGSAFAPALCLDAGLPPWGAGRAVLMQRCVRGARAQAFAYHRDLTLVLAASETVARPLGLCVDGGSPHAAGNPILLQDCQATAPARHIWSYNGSGNFEGTADGSSVDGYCLNLQFPDTPNRPMVLGRGSDGNCFDPYSSRQVFAPYAPVGAGMANPPNTTGQLVNFEQFGRCLDIPNGRASLGHLIAWPCKQSPDGSYVGWNQAWILPTLSFSTASCRAGAVPCGKGTINITAPAGKATPVGTYCVKSPGSTAAGRYVDILDECPAGTPDENMTWTVYGDTDDPLTRYHIVDYRGNCLVPSLTDLFTSGEGVGKLVMVPCADSDLQMWNAPANARDPSPLKDIRED